MEFDFSKTKKPMATAPVSLETVFLLHADPSYDVIKKEPRRGYVALRTTGGSGRIFIEGIAPMTVLPNSLIFFEHAGIHRYFCESDRWDFWWFEFTTPDSLMLPMNTLMYMEMVKHELTDCRTCLELLRNEIPESHMLASAILNQLLYKWAYAFSLHQRTNSPHYESIYRTIDRMHKNLSAGVTVAELAKNAGLSERRFRQVFKEIIGKQPKHYLDEIRMDLAEELLRNTNMKLMVIAEKLGYSSAFHFSREFKKHCGVAPSDYRKPGN